MMIFFFTVGVVKHWYSLLREVVDAPSLELLKARLRGSQPGLVEDIHVHGRTLN